jgi:hypothetical protein
MLDHSRHNPNKEETDSSLETVIFNQRFCFDLLKQNQIKIKFQASFCESCFQPMTDAQHEEVFW